MINPYIVIQIQFDSFSLLRSVKHILNTILLAWNVKTFTKVTRIYDIILQLVHIPVVKVADSAIDPLCVTLVVGTPHALLFLVPQ